VAHDAALISTLFSVGGTVGSLALMRFLDRRGALLIAVLPLVGFPLVASLGLGLSIPTLMVAVFSVGFCVAGTQAGLNAVASIIYPTSFRSKGTGTAIGVAKIGSITGPIIGGVLIGNHFSTASLFEFAAVPVALAGAFALLLGFFQGGGGALTETIEAEVPLSPQHAAEGL